MSKDNFIKLSRLLADDPVWLDARPTHQAIFICILFHMAWGETEQSHKGHVVKIKPMQLYISQRKLAEWTNKWITKDDVIGAIGYFSRHNFLHQTLHHGKMLITVTNSDVCDQINKSSPPSSPTLVHQKSTTKEEEQEHKEYKKNNNKAVVFFECLKDLDLSEEEKATLSKYPEDRVKLAVEFSKSKPFTKDLISQLVWHTKQPIAPSTPSRFTAQQQMAFKFNEWLKTIPIYNILSTDNEDNKIENHYMEIPLLGNVVQISLKTDEKEIEKDFNQSKREVENALNSNRKASKINQNTKDESNYG